MNNDYLFLPVSFAAAMHAALLFGFPKHPRPAPIAIPPTTITPFHFTAPDEDPPIVAEADKSEPSPKVAPDAPLPRQREPVPSPVGAMPMMTPPQFPPVDTGKMTKVFDDSLASLTNEDGARWKNVIPDTWLDNPPRTRFQASPFYPHAAKQAGTHGEVVVEFLVDERGRVIDPRIVRSSDRIFEEPTLRAVAKWQFEPGRRGGKIVAFRMAVPVLFKLTE